MVCDDRLGSTNMFTNLPIDHINTSIAESSGRATRKGSPTRVLENRANQLPQFSADELAIHCSPYFTLQAHAKPTIESKRDYRKISLFSPQCLHRIDARCPPRGNDTCERGHREQRCGNCGIYRGIERLDLIEQVAHQL